MKNERHACVHPGSPLAAEALSYGVMKLRIELEVLRNGVAEIEIWMQVSVCAGGGGGHAVFHVEGERSF